jgi:hypothetical protein
MTRAFVAVALLLAGCNVQPLPTSGGATLPSRGDCPTGLAVVSSDYLSSEIALLSPSGKVASPAFVSSSSTRASGLAAAFSGDIVAEPAPSRPGELAIVDRFGTNVISFVDTRTAEVRAQLPVGTGFEANAQAYLELDEHTAFVPRVGENAKPGREAFDAGSDLLRLDPSVPAIVGSLPMPRKDGYFPTPVGATLVGSDVVVTLQHAKPGYSGMAESELVVVDVAEASVAYRRPLPGLKNCGTSKLSPNRTLLAIACEGYIDRKGAPVEPETSGLVLLDPAQAPFEELRRFSALELFDGPIQTSVEFVSERVVLLKTQTALGAARDNRLFSLDIESGKTTLLESAARDESGLGFGIAFGGMSCAAGCGDACFVSDASRGKLLRYRLRGDALEADDDVVIGGAGLPPLGITPFW